MHQSSLSHVQTCCLVYAVDAGTVVDIGSMDVNGTYRHLFPAWRYIGVDMEPGLGIDIVVHKLYRYPIRAAAPIS
jgi:hypothetical protein